MENHISMNYLGFLILDSTGVFFSRISYKKVYLPLNFVVTKQTQFMK